MSIQQFVNHGTHRGMLCEVPAKYNRDGPTVALKVYDIGETELVGVVYPDGSRQANSLSWYPPRVAELLAAKKRPVRKQPLLRRGKRP